MWLGICGTWDASASLYSFREIRVHCHLLTSGIMTEDVENIVHRMTKILRRNGGKGGRQRKKYKLCRYGMLRYKTPWSCWNSLDYLMRQYAKYWTSVENLWINVKFGWNGGGVWTSLFHFNFCFPCILISTKLFCQKMHYLLKHKILQFIGKIFSLWLLHVSVSSDHHQEAYSGTLLKLVSLNY